MGSSSYSYVDDPTLYELREIQRRNLGFLTVQAGKFGAANLPVHIHNQINDAIAEINAINSELDRRGVKSDDPPPGSSVQTIINHYHNYVDARGSQGFINQSSGPVRQVFDSRNIDTGGGDYAEGDINKQTYAQPPRPGGQVSLQAALTQTQAALGLAQQAGNDDLSEELEVVVKRLTAAHQAQLAGDSATEHAKARSAREKLQSMARQHPELGELANVVGKIELG